MALNWTDKVNGVDDVLAEDINNIANEVISIGTGKEDKVNKITAIDENSTDEQYPTAKTVYSALTETHNIFANSLKNNVREVNSVFMKDVSPVSHTINVNTARANLLKYPYPDTTKTENGVTFTDNGNGTITVNGTATEDSFFNFGDAGQLELSNDFVFSSSPDKSEAIGKHYITIEIEPDLISEHIFITDNGVGSSYSKRGTVVNVFLMLQAGNTYNNVTFKPQINLGNTLLTFTPYVNSIENLTITQYNKNLIPPIVLNYGNWVKENDLTYHSPYWELPQGNYSINTMVKENVTATGYLYIQISDTINFAIKDTVYARQNGAVVTNKFSVNEGKKYVRLWWYDGTPKNPFDVYENVQIELGNNVTSYETPTEPTVYTPNVDGVIENLGNIFPNMTLVSNINGIIIDAEYNRDVNKAYDELKQAIINLGGIL